MLKSFSFSFTCSNITVPWCSSSLCCPLEWLPPPFCGMPQYKSMGVLQGPPWGTPQGGAQGPPPGPVQCLLHPGSPFLTPVGTPDTLSESGSIKSSSRSRRQASPNSKGNFLLTRNWLGQWTTAAPCLFSLPKSLPPSRLRLRASRAATEWSNFGL